MRLHLAIPTVKGWDITANLLLIQYYKFAYKNPVYSRCVYVYLTENLQPLNHRLCHRNTWKFMILQFCTILGNVWRAKYTKTVLLINLVKTLFKVHEGANCLRITFYVVHNKRLCCFFFFISKWQMNKNIHCSYEYILRGSGKYFWHFSSSVTLVVEKYFLFCADCSGYFIFVYRQNYIAPLIMCFVYKTIFLPSKWYFFVFDKLHRYKIKLLHLEYMSQFN